MLDITTAFEHKCLKSFITEFFGGPTAAHPAANDDRIECICLCHDNILEELHCFNWNTCLKFRRDETEVLHLHQVLFRCREAFDGSPLHAAIELHDIFRLSISLSYFQRR